MRGKVGSQPQARSRRSWPGPDSSHPALHLPGHLGAEGPQLPTPTPCPAPHKAFAHVPVGDSLWPRKSFFLFLSHFFYGFYFPWQRLLGPNLIHV